MSFVNSFRKLYRKLIKFCLTNEQYIKVLRKDGVKVGDGCVIWKNVVFGSEPYLISIGNHCRITDGVKFVTHDGGLWVIREMERFNPNNRHWDILKEITVGDNVHIGWNTIIMPGVHIGNNVVIGCGAIVTKDIPSNSVAVGVPARVIEDLEIYFQKNKSSFIDTTDMNAEDKRRAVMGIFMHKEKNI